MRFDPIFFPVLWRFFKSESGLDFVGRKICVRLWQTTKMSSNYLQNTAPERNSQIIPLPVAASGDQIIRNFIIKKQLAVLSEYLFR